MTTEKIEEIKNLPLKDRIITDSETKRKHILNYVEDTKNKLDYDRYIINKTKNNFYNGHFIDYKNIIEEYSNAKNMLLLDLRGTIIVFPILLLKLIKIEEIPNLKQIEVIVRVLENQYSIMFDDINIYKTKLEYKHTWSEVADYEYILDNKFFLDKLERIEVLYNRDCITYEDYNKTYERHQ